MTYTIGLITNPRLAALAAPLAAEALGQRAASGAEKVRLLGETVYQAESWEHPRRVIIKAEALARGRTPASSSPPAPIRRALYDWYVDRGDGENGSRISRAPFADRLSDHRFWANQFRLLARRGLLVARYAAPLAGLDAVARMQLDTLRLRLLKIGGRVWHGATASGYA